jgi:hypothetical protein
LITVYPKNVTANLTKAQRNQMTALTAVLDAEGQRQK